jgi:hypothetical protein
MKKVLLMVAILLGVKEVANGQEIFASATNKAVDGYLTLGYINKGWGVFIGSRYNDNNLVSPKSGTISDQMKYGLIKTIAEDKWIAGAGVQPTNEGHKLNAFIGYNPLKSKDMKLWMIGNIVGDVFTPGLGLSYKIK